MSAGMRTQLSCSWSCWLIMSAWGILWLDFRSQSWFSGMRFPLNRVCVIRSRVRRSRAWSVMDCALCLYIPHGPSAEQWKIMDAVTFVGNKRDRKFHQEQQDPRHCEKECAIIRGKWCCTSTLLFSCFQDWQLFSMIHRSMIMIIWPVCLIFMFLKGGVWLKIRAMGTRHWFGWISGCFQQTTSVWGKE